jgi:uncharacterized protein YdeI (YjbR/CyaY-like superfamily)
MPEVNPLKIKMFVTPKELCQWLSLNHASETELWVKIFKKKTGLQSVTWNELVIEVLCWGWIDGIKKSLDDSAYLQRITPRKPLSGWSKRNTKHVERLISEGRMQESGLKQVQAAKADGRWESAYVVSEMEVPIDFVKALDHQPQTKQFYQSLSKSSRYVIAHGLLSAKKPETRQRRFSKYMDMLVKHQKPT